MYDVITSMQWSILNLRGSDWEIHVTMTLVCPRVGHPVLTQNFQANTYRVYTANQSGSMEGSDSASEQDIDLTI